MTNPASCMAKGHNGTVTFDGDFVTIERTGFWRERVSARELNAFRSLPSP